MKINKSMSILKLAMPIIAISFFVLLFIFCPDKIGFIVNAFKPLITSFILAYLMDSLVRIIGRKLRIRRAQAILLTCIFVLSVILIIFSILVPMIIENAEAVIMFVTNDNMDINIIIENIAERINKPYFDKLAEEFIRLSADIKQKINELLKLITGFLINSVTAIGSSVLGIVTSFILALYMLIEKYDLIARIKRFIHAFFNERNARMILETSSNANKVFKSFLIGKLLDSLIVGILSIIVFTIFNIPYGLLMGSIIGLFNVIPYFGPIIGAIPVIIVSFFVDPSKAFIALIIIIVIGQLDGNFIDPKIVGSNVGVSPFWVISAVVVGGYVLGPVGMILGVPVMVLVKTIIEENVEVRLREKGMEEYLLDKIKDTKTKQ